MRERERKCERRRKRGRKKIKGTTDRQTDKTKQRERTTVSVLFVCLLVRNTKEIREEIITIK